MTVSGKLLIEKFSDTLHHLEGSLDSEALQPCSPDSIEKNSIIFLGTENQLESVFNSECSIVIVSEKLKTAARQLNMGRKLLMSSPNPTLSMAFINKEFFAPYPNKKPFDENRVHPTAIISKTAEISETAIVGPYAVVGAHCKIADSVIIGSHAVIEPNVNIGKESHIHSQAFIGHDVVLGENVEIHPHSSIGTEGYGYAQDKAGKHYRIPHLGTVIIGNDVHIGSGVNVDRGTYGNTTIGEGTKIDNHCHIAHNSSIGKYCLMTAGFICAGSAKIGDHCVFGGRASVTGHVTLTSGVTVGPLAGVISNIEKPGMYAGYPEMPFNEFRRSYATIRQLPKMRKMLSKVAKKLGIEEE